MGHSTSLRINPPSDAELGLKSGSGLAVETSVVGVEGNEYDPKTLFLVPCSGDEILGDVHK